MIDSPRRIISLAFALIAMLATVSSPIRTAADDWPAWRGPRGDGVSLATGLPTRWGLEENTVWRTPLPGPAGSTPVVWDDRIFLTAVDRDSEELVLLCLNTDGQQLWRRVLGNGAREVRGDEGNAASPSPVTDGRHVWALFTSGDFGCYDFNGNEVWRFNVQDRYGAYKISFGMTSTPVLDGERLYLQLIHGGGHHVVCLDKATGAEVFCVERPSDAVGECLHAYASPQIYRDDERAFLLTHGADYIVAHDLDDGRELWRCGGLHPARGYDRTLRFVASPLAVPGMIVVPSAKRGPTLALQPTGEGDITDALEHHRWRYEVTPDVPSPLYHDGLVYLCRETGVLICLDAATGEVVYEERLHADRYRASPVYVDGKVLLTARGGRITVVRAGREFEIMAENDLGEPMAASPVVAGGRIYLRSFDALWAVGGE